MTIWADDLSALEGNKFTIWERKAQDAEFYEGLDQDRYKIIVQTDLSGARIIVEYAKRSENKVYRSDSYYYTSVIGGFQRSWRISENLDDRALDNEPPSERLAQHMVYSLNCGLPPDELDGWSSPFWVKFFSAVLPK